MLYRLPFYIGNFMSYFVPGRERRHCVRGRVNVFFFYIPICFFIKRTYGERVKSIQFIRQITMNRMTCVVNDKYYVKVFRNVSVQQLNNYKFLLDFIRPNLKVKIPEIFVAKHIPMYVCEKLPGTDMRDFDHKLILKNEKKLKTQVFDIIDSIQKIPVKSIPGYERFSWSMQPERGREKECEPGHEVLAHFDLNIGNFLLDKDLNITSVIDWDTLSIAKNPNTDKDVFLIYWDRRYKENKLSVRR